MFAEIRIRCGKNLPLATLLQAPTIETLALVLKGNETADWSSLVPINPDGSRLPFFCVHGAGGNILNLLLLARYLDPDQPVYAFQSSGLDGKQAPIATVEEMAEHYLSEMRRVRPNGPYLLGGLSFGGLIAFEMAQQLCSQGQEVRLLALLDTHGAGYPAPLWRRLPDHVAHLRRLGCVEYFICFRAQYDRFSRRLGRKIRQLAYELAEGLGCRLTDTLQKIEMTNRRAQDCYTLQLYPGRIVLFRVEEQMVGGDPQLGWGQIASDRLDILDTPGDHATFIEEPLVKTLAEKLTTILLKSQCSADKDL
jgi:thioesterase domain-containing protein